MATDFLKFVFLNKFIGAKGLLRQFAIAASFMILVGMTITGAWLTNQIQDGVIHHTMLSTAVFIERYMQPLIVELRTKDRFSDDAIENLDKQVKQGLIAKQLLSIKIWKPDGTVVFSTDRKIIGQKFEVEDALKTAVNGEIGIEYGELHSAENKYERTLNKKLIEIYVPMFDLSNGRFTRKDSTDGKEGCLHDGIHASTHARLFSNIIAVDDVELEFLCDNILLHFLWQFIPYLFGTKHAVK